MILCLHHQYVSHTKKMKNDKNDKKKALCNNARAEFQPNVGFEPGTVWSQLGVLTTQPSTRQKNLWLVLIFTIN